ncbi:maleylpyruvate isomerase family mycothiol-dependent enzyme [Actinocorallia populi]|uniref:maleylpyruvate isomerase family mycothiol-dependent enzyme n=1 Tax=Actinocorallia populi TaxID=2079200 RepID=UPI000D086ED3|nr:maleylpyruvate isomerase family mycothiol-dependent enzyme [Actinocorallia populi]
MMDHRVYCDLLEPELVRLAAAIGAAEPGAAVPGCDGWTALDLAQHVGVVHRWATRLVETAATARIPFREVPVEYPAHWGDYPGWIEEGGRALVAALRAVDGAAPVWAWGPDQHMRFWSRRQFHEVMVHRVDAERAAGLSPAIDPVHAVDAIDEFLENISSGRGSGPAVAAACAAGPGTVHLHATDADGEWMIHLAADGYRWERGHGKGDAAVRAPVADLLLLTYGRRAPEGLEVFGDQALLTRWCEASRL